MSSVRLLITGALLAILSFVAVYQLRTRDTAGSVPAVALPATGDISDSVRLANIGVRPGTQLAIIYFGGTGCIRCHSPEMIRIVKSIRDSLRGDLRFSAIKLIGVAIDADIEAGSSYLKKFGEGTWNEISIGAGWQNEFVRQYMWSDSLKSAAVPRLVFLTYDLTALLDPIELRYSPHSVLLERSGTKEIAEWYEAFTMSSH